MSPLTCEHLVIFSDVEKSEAALVSGIDYLELVVKVPAGSEWKKRYASMSSLLRD